MIPNQTAQNEIVGNTDTVERTQFGIDQNSMAHIMSLLTDLYSDPTLAVIREYSTNALDAHVAAGNPAPIEVSLPSNMDPTLVVRDFGVGLSRDQIEKNYTQYGYSSKRETNTQSGMLGLGCKSALTFTTQFTLRSVFGGRKLIVIVGRDEFGVGFLQTVSDTETDEPNGVEISVPVPPSRIHDMNIKAQEFFSYWTPGTVLLNGEAPQTFKERAEANGEIVTALDEDIFLIKGGSYANHKSHVVMGNVAYPIELSEVFRNETIYDLNSWSLVAFVPMGSVEFTPAREGLHKTAQTAETLKTIHDYVAETYNRMRQAEIDAHDSILEASIYVSKAKRFVGPRNAVNNWRGEIIPQTILVDGYRWHSHIGQNRDYSLETGAQRARMTQMRPENLAKAALVVYGCSRVTLKTKKQTQAHIDTLIASGDLSAIPHGDSFEVLYALSPVDERFVRNVTELDTLREYKVDLPVGERVKASAYRQIVSSTGIHQVDEIDSAYTHIVMVPAGEPAGEKQRLVNLASVSRSVLPKINPFFASVYKGREDVFKKKNPTAISVDEYYKVLADEVQPLYTARVVMSSQFTRLDARVAPARVLDPRLTEYITMETPPANAYEISSLVVTLNTHDELVEAPDTSEYKDLMKYVSRQYPFLFWSTYGNGVASFDWTSLCNSVFVTQPANVAVSEIRKLDADREMIAASV